MKKTNEIRLRLRFYKDVKQNIETVRQKFKDVETKKSENCVVKTKFNHIWMTVPESKRRYWSPHLHLELESINEEETHIRGLFGPDQALWTFFMFLHFIIAGIFLIFCAIAYSNHVLKEDTTMDYIIMSFMVFLWFLLYVIAKQIRSNGNGQMNELEEEFLKILQ